MNSTSRYRAAIIGLGFIGGADQVSGDALGQRVVDLDGTHFAALSSHPRIALVAGSSRDAGRRERFAERSGAQTYSDWRQMLAEQDLDIVSVATYAPQHPEMVVSCAERGIPAIYCEKPIANNLPDAERMIAACQSAGSQLVINHNRQFDPDYAQVRDAIAEDRLGTLISGSLVWPSGRLGNVGTHMIDAIQLLASLPVTAVSGTLDLSGRPDCRGADFRDPGGCGVLRLGDNLLVTVDAADHSRVPARITLNGTQGAYCISGTEVYFTSWDGRRELVPSRRGAGSSMDRAVEEIVNDLDQRRSPNATAESARRTLEAIVAFHASHARNGAWTSLPLSDGDRQIVVHSG